MNLAELCDLASKAGYEGLCMRASQIGIHSADEEIRQAVEIIRDRDLKVTMVSGDFDIVYNNENGPNCLRNITPYLKLAETLGAGLIRVCIKTEDDLRVAQRAADEAIERNVTLVHQCHVQSLFETLDQIETGLRTINRPNFGLIYEAANLEECRQDYGVASIQRLAPWIKNVYLQNQALNPKGAVTLETWTHGPISFDIIDIPESGGLRFSEIIAGLKQVDYQGYLTVHQSAPEDGSNPTRSAANTARYLRDLMSSNP